MQLKKYLTYAIAAFVIYYLLSLPENAAHVVQGAASGLASAADSLSRFVNELSH